MLERPAKLAASQSHSTLTGDSPQSESPALERMTALNLRK